MKAEQVNRHIINWLKWYCEKAGMKGFIIGISGGIDSAVTSTLCAMTGKEILVVSMPIHQKKDQLARANEHMDWLKSKFTNVKALEVDLSNSFESVRTALPAETGEHKLSMANTRARLRMLTLYALGQSNGLLVAGTGNKVEDFGVGFYTKYGDGGVDLSPIADLTKTHIFALAKHLGIVNSIQIAKPTDGLWEVDRTDEDQLGATYPELEWAMEYIDSKSNVPVNTRQEEVLKIYKKFNAANKHKMDPIPVCLIPKELLE
ncbi:MAG TPA: NAD(+) synthase [Flavobacteriales bacterium]|nr:NAD(+) synthase [Flavobacteriales bacterium]